MNQDQAIMQNFQEMLNQSSQISKEEGDDEQSPREDESDSNIFSRKEEDNNQLKREKNIQVFSRLGSVKQEPEEEDILQTIAREVKKR